MSSLDTFVPDNTPLTLNGKDVKISKATLRQLFRLLALADKVKGDLGMTREDLKSTELSGAGVSKLVGRVVEACVGQVDFSLPATELSPTAKVVLGEFGSLLGVTADDIADAPLDELHTIVLKYWEVNANGPLGEKIRSTIGKLAPMMELAKDVVMMGFQKELIKALPVGGIPGGGTTGSSSQSSESSSGPSDTFSTESTLEPSSNSLNPSDTTDDSSQPATTSPGPVMVDLSAPAAESLKAPSSTDSESTI